VKTLYFRYKRLIFPVLFISFAYNVLWFALFLFIVFSYLDYLVILTILFLFFYMAIAQPLKDYLIDILFKQSIAGGSAAMKSPDRSIRKLEKLKDLYGTLAQKVKEYEIDYLCLYTRYPDFSQKIFTRMETPIHIHLTEEQFTRIAELLQGVDRLIPVGTLQGSALAVAQQNGWKMVIPIYYRSRFIGFIAVSRELRLSAASWLNSLVARIGLLFENENLAESALKNQVFRKEFHVARKMEKLLVNRLIKKIGPFTVRSHFESIEGGNNELLFEYSIFQDQREYLFFARIEKSKRGANFILFSILGYFVSATSGGADIAEVCRYLNKYINKSGQGFSIEGILLQFDTDGAKILLFGSGVSVESDGVVVPHRNKTPVGRSLRSVYNPVELATPGNIRVFSSLRLVLDLDSRE